MGLVWPKIFLNRVKNDGYHFGNVQRSLRYVWDYGGGKDSAKELGDCFGSLKPRPRNDGGGMGSLQIALALTRMKDGLSALTLRNS